MEKQHQVKQYEIDSNFSTLLDVPMDGQVLVLGNGFDWVGKFFKNIQYKILGDQYFDIIFYSPNTEKTNLSIKNKVRALKKNISKRGFLLLLIDNSLSFSTVRHLIKRKAAPQKNRTCTNFISFLYLIRSFGFPCFRTWIPIVNPGGDFHEIVDLKFGKIETIHYEHWLVRFFNQLGIKHYVNDSFLAICGQRSIEDSKIFCQINKIIGGNSGANVIASQLIRFDLRLRGALIAFIKEPNCGEKFIARITGNTKTDLIIRENNAFLSWLYTGNRLPFSLTKCLPCPIGKTSFGSTNIYIEQMMTGVPAWKADSVKLEEKIYQQADKFITEFGLVTSKPVLVDEDVFSEMFQFDINRIENCELVGMDFKNRLRGLLKKVKEKLLGKTVISVVSHGDYGYGNILVSQTTGELTGIIDWDTGRKTEFFWIDRMNMELQLLIKIKQETLSGALKYLWNRVVDHKDRFTLYNSYYKQRFKVSSQLLQLLIIITLIRFISRSVQYPHLLRHAIIEYENSLKFLAKKW